MEPKSHCGLCLHDYGHNFPSDEEVGIETHATNKAQLTEQIQERMKEVGKRFQELELTAMKAGEVEARAKIERARHAITEKRDALERRLQALRNARDSALDEAREGVVSAWSELNEALEKAREELEGVTA